MSLRAHQTNFLGQVPDVGQMVLQHFNHSATGVSPFEVTFGHKSPSIPQYLTGTSNVVAVDDILSDREVVFASLKKKLLKFQEHMKALADPHKRDVNFEPGEWVMVKLRPQSPLSNFGN